MIARRLGAPCLAYPFGLLAAFALGVALRAGPVLTHSWPLQDGGMFFEMVGEILRAGLRIPAFTAYDGAGIPFAYPPLALWLAAATEAVSPLSRPDVTRLLPLAFSLLELPAMYFLAREVLPDRRHAVVALAVFGVEPYAYQFHITGGGLTRSLGFLFATLAVWQGLRLIRGPRVRRLLLTGLLAGLAALSHPEAGPLVAVGLGAAWLCLARSRSGLASLLGAAVLTVAVAAPWWLNVILVHGPGPLIAALTGSPRDLVAGVVTFFFLQLFHGPLPALGILSLLGQVHVLVRRQPFLVLWTAAACILDTRYAAVSTALPIAMLVAVGLLDVVVPAATALGTRLSAPQAAAWGRGVGALGLGLVVGVGLVQDAAWFGPTIALTTADRSAMTWVATGQPQDRRFAIIGGGSWGSDDLSEWFPALTGLRSLTTSQGLEWTTDGSRQREADAEEALRTCQNEQSAACLGSWLDTYVEPAGDWALYVAANGSMYAQPGTDCCAAARAWVRADPELRVIYDGPGALIAAPIGSAAEAASSPAR